MKAEKRTVVIRNWKVEEWDRVRKWLMVHLDKRNNLKCSIAQ